MNREQALQEIEELIFAITSEYERGLAVGFIHVCLRLRLIVTTEHTEFFNRAMAE